VNSHAIAVLVMIAVMLMWAKVGESADLVTIRWTDPTNDVSSNALASSDWYYVRIYKRSPWVSTWSLAAYANLGQQQVCIPQTPNTTQEYSMVVYTRDDKPGVRSASQVWIQPTASAGAVNLTVSRQGTNIQGSLP